MRIFARVLAGLALAIAPAGARAKEEIFRYVSDVQIQRDSSLEVAETIVVYVEHDLINHGIYRDFPTRYRGRNGSQMHVGFTFEGATIDGAPVRATAEPYGNGIRIKIGDPDRLVDIGKHEYVLHYRTTRQVGRFPGFDELYWNATGSGWIFRIDIAEARIRLPRPVRFGQRSVYTGPQGSIATNAEVVQEQPGLIVFRTTRALGPYQGLTVAAAFPKGVVAEPTAGSRFADMLRDYGPPAVGLAGLAGMLLFYYVAWRRAGRDPRAGTVVPIFSPPEDLSPAGMRYVTKMHADNRGFAAALVDLGVRGYVRIREEEGGGWHSKTTRTIERLASDAPLPHDEQEAVERLGKPGDTIAMKQENHEVFSSAQKALSKVLKEQYEGKLFKRHLGWAAAGLFLFGIVFWLACAAVVAATYGAVLWQVGVVAGSFAVAGLLWLAFHESTTGKCLLTVVGLAALVAAYAIGMPTFAEAIGSGWFLPWILPALAAPLVISAFWWIAAPTKEGRAVLDHIAGFKQYLSITERERLDRMTPLKPPPDTPEVFEKYLPYAIALGVENRWADRFQSVLAASAAQGQQSFGWYSGSSSPWSNPTGFVDNVGSSLSNAVGFASTAPGSGGGGSSGGGGGGGGGGGW